MSREDWDRTWEPYCLRCDTMMRMKSLGVFMERGKEIQKFECRVPLCGAKHEREYPKEGATK